MAGPQRNNNGIPIASQAYRMAALFPVLRANRGWHKGTCIWRGPLQPTEASSSYHVRIEYQLGRPPRVWVLRPALHPSAPHRFPDGRLCLYCPRDRSWHPGLYIADIIVPWIAEWLLFYELWLETGRWVGAEAEHEGPKEEPVTR